MPRFIVRFGWEGFRVWVPNRSSPSWYMFDWVVSLGVLTISKTKEFRF